LDLRPGTTIHLHLYDVMSSLVVARPADDVRTRSAIGGLHACGRCGRRRERNHQRATGHPWRAHIAARCVVACLELIRVAAIAQSRERDARTGAAVDRRPTAVVEALLQHVISYLRRRSVPTDSC